MKTVLVLAGLVAFALAGTVPSHYNVKTKPVDAEFVARQKKILSLFEFTEQMNYEADYYKIGKDYNIEAHIEDYTDKKAFEEFLYLYRDGFLPKYHVFSIFEERMREEAIVLFKLFYTAKDFETFYKTACFARVHFNHMQFYYAMYVAVFHRADTQGFVLPAPYEVFPEYFTNMETIYKGYLTKMQDGLMNPEEAHYFGVVKENDQYVYYANYSNYWTYGDEEHRLSYFTEDVGLNTYYFFFHTFLPFWMETTAQYTPLKERRGEFYYYFYQQFLARYYLERLSNGLGEIPDFSWYEPLKTGYTPFLSTGYLPFIQRNNYYKMNTEKYYEDIQFLDTYEKTFQQYLQRGHFKAYNQEIDFRSSKAINFVGNYWQANADLYDKSEPRNFYRSYEHVARRVMGAAPEPLDKHTIAPTALSFYMTSARDPAFYQLYSKILKNFLLYKEYLEPYTPEYLNYAGVKINDVNVDKLVTYYDFFDYDITNSVYAKIGEFNEQTPAFKVRQPRLNHKPFNVEIDVKSDIDGQAVFKIFLGPKYDSKGYPIKMEDDWMNFVELDAFVHKLTPGQNKIVRKSEEFFFYKEDSIPTHEISKLLDQGKAPVDMSEYFEWMPKRLMLPRGIEGGFPYQFFVVVYPYETLGKEYEPLKEYFVDAKPLGYPLDRPVYEPFFKQPNMYFEDVSIFFEGAYFPYTLNNPFYVPHQNQVPKH